MQYNTMQCNAFDSTNAMQCNAMQCNAMQYNTLIIICIKIIYYLYRERKITM